eukprot:462860_1
MSPLWIACLLITSVQSQPTNITTSPTEHPTVEPTVEPTIEPTTVSSQPSILTGSTFDCTNTIPCANHTISCDPNKDCHIICHDTISCLHAHIICPMDANCIIDCGLVNTSQSFNHWHCHHAYINATASTSLSLYCSDAHGCDSASVYCPIRVPQHVTRLHSQCVIALSFSTVFNVYAVQGFNDVQLVSSPYTTLNGHINMHCTPSYGVSCNISSISLFECDYCTTTTFEPTISPTPSPVFVLEVLDPTTAPTTLISTIHTTSFLAYGEREDIWSTTTGLASAILLCSLVCLVGLCYNCWYRKSHKNEENVVIRVHSKSIPTSPVQRRMNHDDVVNIRMQSKSITMASAQSNINNVAPRVECVAPPLDELDDDIRYMNVEHFPSLALATENDESMNEEQREHAIALPAMSFENIYQNDDEHVDDVRPGLFMHVNTEEGVNENENKEENVFIVDDTPNEQLELQQNNRTKGASMYDSCSFSKSTEKESTHSNDGAERRDTTGLRIAFENDDHEEDDDDDAVDISLSLELTPLGDLVAALE